MSNLFGHLFHTVPLWVASGACFHIRIRVEHDEPKKLTQPEIARPLLAGIKHYHELQKWHAWLAVIMPDHIHALLSFPPDAKMSQSVGNWKKYQRQMLNIKWQENYFDHRIRNDNEFELKAAYIRMNPVRASLCEEPEKWPWIFESIKGC